MATPTTNPDPRIVQDFDPEALWALHGKKITIAVAVVAVVGLGIYIWQRNAAQQAETAAAQLAAARDATSLEQVVKDYPRQEVAAQALMRLSDAQYNDGKYEAAGQAYQQFLEQFPSHPFAPSALIGLASIKEATRDYQAAYDQYQQILAANPRGYVTLAATMGVARCLEALGKPVEARQKYEEVLAMAQGTRVQTEAYLRLATLERTLPAQSPAPVASLTVPAQKK